MGTADSAWQGAVQTRRGRERAAAFRKLIPSRDLRCERPGQALHPSQSWCSSPPTGAGESVSPSSHQTTRQHATPPKIPPVLSPGSDGADELRRTTRRQDPPTHSLARRTPRTPVYNRNSCLERGDRRRRVMCSFSSPRNLKPSLSTNMPQSVETLAATDS